MRKLVLVALVAMLPMLAQAATITYSRTDFPSGRPPERIMAPSASDNDIFEEVFQTGNALHTYSAYRGAGERIEDSTTGTDYLSTSPECKPSGEIDLSSGSGTIYAGPAIVQWLQISTTPGTAASSIDDNTTAKIPLPVSYPVNVYPVAGTVFCTSLKYTRGASATGKFNVCYRPIDPTKVSWMCP